MTPKELEAEVERLRAALREAMPFVCDAGDDEDPEAKSRACELLERIEAALTPPKGEDRE